MMQASTFAPLSSQQAAPLAYATNIVSIFFVARSLSVVGGGMSQPFDQ